MIKSPVIVLALALCPPSPVGGAADLSARLAGIDQVLRRFNSSHELSPEAAFWLPTLALYRDNAARGYKTTRLDEQYVPSDDYRLEQLGKAEELAAALRKDDFSNLYRSGGVECAFSSAVDGILCPYVLYLPQTYAGSPEKHPLIVYLHGANGTQWEIERSASSIRLADFGRGESVMAVPLGRGNSGYKGPAEKDIVQMIERLSRHLRLDPTRRVISGFSMGAIGAWRTALDYPELFDAVIPICGMLPWQVKDLPNLRKLVEATLPRDQIPKDVGELGEPVRDASCFDKLRGRRVIIISSVSDPVVPLDLVHAIINQLEARRVPFQLIEFDRRHTIYPGILGVHKSLY